MLDQDRRTLKCFFQTRVLKLCLGYDLYDRFKDTSPDNPTVRPVCHSPENVKGCDQILQPFSQVSAGPMKRKFILDGTTLICTEADLVTAEVELI
jgi:hypothetical protein